MKTNVIYNRDCLKGMKELPNNSIDLLCTDPPYGINFMNTNWIKANEIVNPQGAYEKKKGFKKLPRQSSAYILKFFTPIWKESLRVLKPGAFAFVMCIPRQDCLARMIVSLEDVGFNVSFTSMYHCFASGFPKASNIGKLADKRYKKRTEYNGLAQYIKQVIKDSQFTLKDIRIKLQHKMKGGGLIPHWITEKSQPTVPIMKDWKTLKEILKLDNSWDWLIEQETKRWEEAEREVVGKHLQPAREIYQSGKLSKDVNLTLPATPQAQALDGSYGGFQPKPAVEVVIVAMKPLSEKTYVDQALANRKGITWLDKGRIPYESKEDKDGAKFGPRGESRGRIGQLEKFRGERYIPTNQGRFPANLLCSGDVLNDGKISDARGGIPKGRQANFSRYFGKEVFGDSGATYNDSGSFSRYFSLDAWWEKRLRELPKSVRKTFPFLIVSKASKAEKNRGCENLEKEIGHNRFDKCKKCGGYILQNPDRPSACKCGKPEREHNKIKGNFHPTCKPLKLMSYLITLGSREGDIILDPFAGSGTTLIAAKMLNRGYIGYEINKEYFDIAKARIGAITTQLSLFT